MSSREHPSSPPLKKKVADGVGVHPFFSSKSTATTSALGHFVPSPSTVCHYLHLDPFHSQGENENEAGPSTSTSKTGSPTKPHPPISTTHDDHETETQTETGTRANVNVNGNGDGAENKKIQIVFYDLDGTLVKTRSGSDFPTNRSDWQWWDSSVPTQLKREWAEGKHLVVLSNQGDGREKIKSEWKAKLPLIAAKVSPVSWLL